MDSEEIKDQERNSAKENKAPTSEKKEDDLEFGCLTIVSLIVGPAWLIYYDWHWGWIVAYVIIDIIAYFIYNAFSNSK